MTFDRVVTVKLWQLEKVQWIEEGVIEDEIVTVAVWQQKCQVAIGNRVSNEEIMR